MAQPAQPLAGEFVPAPAKPPKADPFLRLEVNRQQSAQKQSAAQWIQRCRDMLHENSPQKLAAIINGLDQRLKSAVYMAGNLKRQHVAVGFNELEPTQRQQVFIGLRRLEQLISSLQSHGLYCRAAFNIGESQPEAPPTDEQWEQIEAAKAAHSQAKHDEWRQRYFDITGQWPEQDEQQPQQAQG